MAPYCVADLRLLVKPELGNPVPDGKLLAINALLAHDALLRPLDMGWLDTPKEPEVFAAVSTKVRSHENPERRWCDVELGEGIQEEGMVLGPLSGLCLEAWFIMLCRCMSSLEIIS